jgi:hypothetical protein
MIFPTVHGSNLLRQKMTLPEDFQGKLNIIFIPFYQWQQMEVNSWIAFVQDLEKQTTGLFYYELPTIEDRNVLSKVFINEGMRAGIPNQTSRERTITLYLDKSAFKQALGMPEEEHIYLLLVDQMGNVLYSTRGAFTPQAGDGLSRAIMQISAEHVKN